MGVCNELPIPPTSVTITRGSGSPPSPTGGAIVDGTYTLTESDDYNPGDALVGQPTSAVLVVSHGTMAFVSIGAKGDSVRFNARYEVSGTSIQETGTCGLSEVLVEGYSATPTTITLIQSTPTFVSVFSRS
jgi:hypothetical protein